MPFIIHLSLFLGAFALSPQAIEKATMAETTKILQRLNLANAKYFKITDREKLEKAKIDEEQVIKLVEGLLAVCLSDNKECRELDYRTHEMRVERAEAFLELLSIKGTTKALPLLWKLDARGYSRASQIRKHIYERDMERAVHTSPCNPPSAAEIKRMKESLWDFLVIRVVGTSLKAQPLSATELDDLAYFMVAVSSAGREVVRGNEGGASWTRPGPKNPERANLQQTLEQAKMQGNMQAIAHAARSYLQTLGYPGTIRAKEEDTHTWGGPAFGHVMRELADVDESLGNFQEASDLYRRAPQGGGACGTGDPNYTWENQAKGVIRVEERAGRCRAAVSERLFEFETIDPYRPQSTVNPYEVERLSKAGFDLAKLKRGALVTKHRDIGFPKLKALFAAAPSNIGHPALKRLEQKGPEDWERRLQRPARHER